jgi:hypothetical protein
MLVLFGASVEDRSMQQELNRLVLEYVERKAKNPRYSERAFAKSIGLSPGFLKLFFQGKRCISAKRAKEIADRLGWDEIEAGELINDVNRKKLIQEEKAIVAVDRFMEISDWYHFAILELLKVKNSLTAKELSNQLGISPLEAEFSVRLLCKHGLLKSKNGKLIPKDNYIVPSCSSSAIRKFHKQCLSKAIDAIEEQTKEERDLRSLTLAFDESRKDEASAFIKEFVSKFEKKFGTGDFNRVYQLTLAFFSLDRGKK